MKSKLTVWFSMLILIVSALGLGFAFKPNNSKMLLNPTVIQEQLPRELEKGDVQDKNIKQLDVAYDHSGAIATDQLGNDHLYMWGKNNYGQLGNGNTIDQAKPIEIKLSETTIKTLSLGRVHSGVVTTDVEGNDHLYMWGKNDYGKLGNGSTTNQNVPTIINLSETTIKTLSLGRDHSGAVTTDAEGNDHLYMWGHNNDGQLGDGSTTNQNVPTIINLSETTIKTLSLGYYHSGAITTDENGKNKLYMWGDNNDGEIGNNTKIDVLVPTPIILPSSEIKILALGSNYSGAVIKKDNKDLLYMWGDDANQKLGTGLSRDEAIPTLISLPNSKIKTLSLGYYSSGVVSTDAEGNDRIYMWGSNSFGQLGNGKSDNIVYYPTLTNISATNIQSLVIEYQHAGAIITNSQGQKEIYMWGHNSGLLGNNQKLVEYKPTLIEFPEAKIKILSLGYYHSGAVTTDAEGKDHLYMWGYNNFGKLGIGSSTNYPTTTPMEVTLPENKIKILSLGNNHSGVVTTDAEGNDHLYMWGHNNYGQLGDGTTSTKRVPVAISMPEPLIKDLVLGDYHSGAIITDDYGVDHLYMWGSNSSGKLGDGTIDNKLIPTLIPVRERTIKTLALGASSTSVITTYQGNDHLYMWGYNGYGQLGDGTTTNKHLPIEIILPETTIKTLSLGYNHSGAVTTDAEGNDHLYMWGSNSNGQLGDGTTTSKHLPIEIILPETIIKTLSLGYYYSGIVTTDIYNNDNLYMWGSNSSGQLGNGITNNKSTPTLTPIPETKLKIVSLGQNYSGVVTINTRGDNHLYMWGSNYSTQLGNGVERSISTPIQINLE